MILLPAIDIKDGTCVRLYKGDYSTAHQVFESPLKAAQEFEKQGATWLHMVDLDGAKEKRPVNRAIFEEIAQKTSLQLELGGGIRNMETIEHYLSHGIERVILGSVALNNPQLVSQAVERFGERIAVGIDAKNGMVAVNGWLDHSSVHYLDLALEMEKAGVQTIIYTDIGRDGTLSGPNLEEYKALKETVQCNIIASGGIRDLKDVNDLCNLSLYGAICGKSLYSGTLSLSKALAAVKSCKPLGK